MVSFGAIRMDGELSLGARFLLRLIGDYSRNDGYCYGSQDWLSKKMGCDPRTVRRYLRELMEAKMIRKERFGLQGNNHYFLTEASPNPTPTADADSTPAADPKRTNCPIQTGQIVRSKADKLSDPNRTPPVLSFEFKALNNSSSKEPAAAEAALDEKSRPAAQALVDLGMPDPIAVDYATKDAELVLAAVEHFRWRFAGHRKLRPIHSPVGYMRGVLNNPTQAGFCRDENGRWLPPPREGLTAQQRAKQTAQEAKRHEAATERQAEAEARYRALREQWDGLPEQERAAIAAAVGRDSPLLVQGKAQDDYGPMDACLAELEARDRARNLAAVRAQIKAVATKPPAVADGTRSVPATRESAARNEVFLKLVRSGRVEEAERILEVKPP